MTKQSERRREWWVGNNEDGFSSWLVQKNPDDDRQVHCFVGEKKCVEYIRAIELRPSERIVDVGLLEEMKRYMTSDSWGRAHIDAERILEGIEEALK